MDYAVSDAVMSTSDDLSRWDGMNGAAGHARLCVHELIVLRGAGVNEKGGDVSL
jgi:hypothetical protein